MSIWNIDDVNARSEYLKRKTEAREHVRALARHARSLPFGWKRGLAERRAEIAEAEYEREYGYPDHINNPDYIMRLNSRRARIRGRGVR